MAKHHVGGLDYVRFFAACSVLMLHFVVVSWSAAQGVNYNVAGAPTYPEFDIFRVGWVGVQIFFVLSGLVIAQSADNSTAYRFLRGRIGRLLPAVLICATITLLLILHFSLEARGVAIAKYVRTILFYPAGPWIVDTYWTLSLEVTFYSLIFGLLVINRLNWIEPFAWLLGSFSTVAVIGQTFFHLPHLSMHMLGQHGCYFAIGIFLWLTVRRGNNAFRWLSIATFSIAAIVEINYMVVGVLTGINAIAATSVWTFAVFTIWYSFSHATAGTKFSRTLGLMTYPLYLVQGVLGTLILRLNHWTGKYLALFLAISACFAVSWLVTLVEPTIRRGIELTIDRLFSALFWKPQIAPPAQTRELRPNVL